MTPLTVPEQALQQAVSLRRLGQNTAQILGFGVAGILVTLVGTGWTIAVDALTYALAGGVFSRLQVPPLPVGERASLLGELGDGLREVLRHMWLWVLIAQALVYHLFYGGVQGVLGPIVVGDGFGRAAWGWALSALMAGFVVGGLVTLRWRPRHSLVTGTVFLSLTAAFPLAMAVAPSVSHVLVGAFLHGFGLELFSVWWDLSIQQNIAPDKLARVYSFDLVGSFVARPVGLALTGPVVAVVGQTRWMLLVAAIMAGSSLAAAALPSVRELVRADKRAVVG